MSLVRQSSAFLVLGLCLASVAVAATPMAPSSRDRQTVGAIDKEQPEALALLQRLQAAQRTTELLTAGFQQTKDDELFAKPSIQSGQFAFRTPQSFRWDYEKPERVIVVVTEDTFQRYLPEQKLLRQMDLGKNKRRVFNYFGLGTDVEIFRRHFNLHADIANESRPGTRKLEMTGKRRRVQKRLKLLEMWLDEKSWLPTAIKVTMADGATTLWEFTNMKVNPKVAENLFHLEVPKDTIIQSEDDPHSPLLDDLVEEEEDMLPTASGN